MASQTLQDFVDHWKLTDEAAIFLSAMPETVQAAIAKFDPSRTKDGNIWGREQVPRTSPPASLMRHHLSFRQSLTG